MLFSRELSGVERAMDGLALRFQAEAHNVANINTPGYRRQSVPFEDSLRDAIEESQIPVNPNNPSNGPIPDPTALLKTWAPSITTDSLPQRADGNSVSIEQEMGDLAKTVQEFETETEWVASEYRDIKFVIDAK